jgi:hypothetical protein
MPWLFWHSPFNYDIYSVVLAGLKACESWLMVETALSITQGFIGTIPALVIVSLML